MQTTITKVEHYLIQVILTLYSDLFILTRQNQKMDIKDGVTKLAFHYDLSDNTTTD